jgi:hypothetical protein
MQVASRQGAGLLKRTFIPKSIYQEHLFQSRTDPTTYYNNSASSSSATTHKTSFSASIAIKDKDVRLMLMQFMQEVTRRGAF